ncbi:hypothetical protein CEUSTIGMA_g2685.t1 [Chlamydomonas eustigma]|uniref:Uncharacterized protein n=1 Tax=Chlamydomonas eustigma TaxID=1157962 RepID=A0A250WXI4_9CHLO|nr:hypothetical protein CEUSTIGMA_g2685.t1 [Chlamydomonas eustigma]|eukprot:GAX75240.1 hypothetical protein CEUSTIGMA_g2685.t1 [Chlamydomonas eustigma]
MISKSPKSSQETHLSSQKEVRQEERGKDLQAEQDVLEVLVIEQEANKLTKIRSETGTSTQSPSPRLGRTSQMFATRKYVPGADWSKGQHIDTLGCKMAWKIRTDISNVTDIF